jgi:hypothetical protein
MQGRFSVVLHPKKGKEQAGRNYFLPSNIIVGASGRGAFADFDEASKAAQRARLQDPENRRVTVEEL